MSRAPSCSHAGLHGRARCRRRTLILENKSSTTIQNIANAKKLLPEGADVAVITNDYHLARARRLLAHAGLGDAGVPAKTPYPGQWMAVRCREYCSIMGLMFTGRW
ncbi:YdcF family protein [Butyricicoccus sp. OF13-6]|nr:YdcF family protein [Butyricicoccus sp. OF13-6]